MGYVTVAATKKTDKKISQNVHVIKFPFLSNITGCKKA
jgi:hypothetical protein